MSISPATGPILATTSPDSIKKAASIILEGGLVVCPTESFYGIAADARNINALERIFDIKQRATKQPVLILIPSIKSIPQYAKTIPPVAQRLMDAFWPGGLTLLFKAKPDLPSLLTGTSGKIGMRLSKNPVATQLAMAAGSPITGTSANISGQPACQEAKEVLEVLGNKVDMILDYGKTPGKTGSTILDITTKSPKILREGLITEKEVMRILKASM